MIEARVSSANLSGSVIDITIVPPPSEFIAVSLHRTEVARIMRHAARTSRLLFQDASLTEKHGPKTKRNAAFVAARRHEGSMLGGTADQCKIALDAASPTPETEP